MSLNLKNATFIGDNALRDGGTQMIYVQIGDVNYILKMLASVFDKETENYQKIHIQSSLGENRINEIVDINDIEGIGDFLTDNEESIYLPILLTWKSVINRNR